VNQEDCLQFLSLCLTLRLLYFFKQLSDPHLKIPLCGVSIIYPHKVGIVTSIPFFMSNLFKIYFLIIFSYPSFFFLLYHPTDQESLGIPKGRHLRLPALRHHPPCHYLRIYKLVPPVSSKYTTKSSKTKQIALLFLTFLFPFFVGEWVGVRFLPQIKVVCSGLTVISLYCTHALVPCSPPPSP